MKNLIKDIFEPMPELDVRCDSSLTGKWEDFVCQCGEFNKCLEVEKIGQSIADDFYINYLGASAITRFNYNNPDGRFFQEHDVDCSIEMLAMSLDVFSLNISEKFRQYDTGDMCLELWSNFEEKKVGWAMKSAEGNGPDLYLYVTPRNIFEVWCERYFNKMMSDISSEWTHQKIENLFNEDKYHKKDQNALYDITVGGHDAKLLRSWSRAGDREWYGVCICIPWNTLFNEYLLNINMFDREYNKLNINKEYKACN